MVEYLLINNPYCPDICSLRADVERLAFSVIWVYAYSPSSHDRIRLVFVYLSVLTYLCSKALFSFCIWRLLYICLTEFQEMTSEAEIISTRYTKSVIKSSAALSYVEAQARMDDRYICIASWLHYGG